MNSNIKNESYLSQRQCLDAICILFLLGSLIISASLAFFLGIFILINLSRNMPRFIRISIAFIASTGASLIVGSTSAEVSGVHDALVYYDIYTRIEGGDLRALFYFADGIELGLPFLMYLWSLLLPPLTISGYMFLVSITCSSIMIAWLESFLSAKDKILYPILMGASILLMNLYMANQLTRQFLALQLVLFSVCFIRKKMQYFSLSAASILHLSAIPFYFIIRILKKGWSSIAIFIFFALVIRFYFFILIDNFELMPLWVKEKLTFYLDNLGGYSDPDIKSLYVPALLILISVVTVAYRGYRWSANNIRWLLLPWFTILIQLILLPIPLASTRLALIVTSVLPGFIIFKMLSTTKRDIFTIFIFNGLLVYKIMTADKSIFFDINMMSVNNFTY